LTDQKQQTIPFSTVLASTVHDMKNALSVILSSLADITDKLKEVDPENSKVSVLRYETSRVNGLLVQLLALYKSEQQQLPLNINYHNVYDFLEEQVLSYDDLLTSKNITVSLDVDEELDWAFDSDLMATVISNIISNHICYTDSFIALSASIIDDMLDIAISDDGPGYPELMITNQHDIILGINQSTGSTGLGLYFSGQVASMHQNDNKIGNICLANSANSGGIFTIRIP
jgi:K+-sensing histidine kinase KdpD